MKRRIARKICLQVLSKPDYCCQWKVSTLQKALTLGFNAFLPRVRLDREADQFVTDLRVRRPESLIETVVRINDIDLSAIIWFRASKGPTDLAAINAINRVPVPWLSQPTNEELAS